ncbi:MAG: hypothetical protein COV76_02755 [Candidatus Omnitrophica bacterium CG11_big_fil_rev_8_21_14_0_20_64_10]|nr:MAG: hypothetical protein COV76_02755 [Candidatus Omnitrophica bacterium CG11_big_fil_rev_8_21_14_0_20_64_10]
MFFRRLLVISLLVAVPLGLVLANAPEHFYNDPDNLHPDPDYVPGEYPLADVYNAQAVYRQRRGELAAQRLAAGSDALATQGLGELTFSSIKNESADVLGYFREYLGVVRLEQGRPAGVTLVIDVNSLDTAIPGRNNRILNLLLESYEPAGAFSEVMLDRLEGKFPAWSEWPEGAVHSVIGKGTVRLNGVTRPIEARLEAVREKGFLKVRILEPVELRLSDFGFRERIYTLMQACNHKSISNAVEISAELYLK